MSHIELSHHQLADYLPHRGPNLIPDTVWLAKDLQSSRSLTHIAADDERGRACFSRLGDDGQRYWNEPFLGELVALTGVPMLTEGLRKENKVAVFSAISNAQAPRPAPFHAAIHGEAEITRARSGFAQFRASLSVDGEVVYRAEVMSGSATMADIMGAERQAQPGLDSGETFTAFPWKPTAMTFIDRILAIQEHRIEAGYRYPEDHPFVPGHFPDGPLMMGVTQWMAMGDALAALIIKQGLGDGHYVGEASIRRPDGSEIVTARDLGVAMCGGIPRLDGLKRIMFREVVRPGDELLIHASLGG